MKEFDALRALARQKRDETIAMAKEEYDRTMRSLLKLEQDLSNPIINRNRKVKVTVDSVIPGDRVFTAAELLKALEVAEPARIWMKQTVDKRLEKLVGLGAVVKVKPARVGDPAHYVRAGAPVDYKPHMTLVDTIRLVLVKPMTVTEIAVAVREAGFPSLQNPYNLRSQITVHLKKHAEFVWDLDRWSRVTA